MMQSPAAPLLVDDARSHFAALALGFRTPAQGPELSGALHRAVADLPARLRPVWHAWTPDAGTARLVAVLPADAAAAMRRLLLELLEESPVPLNGPACSVVGDLDVLQAAGLAEDAGWIGQCWDPAPVTSSLHQSAVQGYEQLIVQGSDPAGQLPPAAVFLAMCLLNAGEHTLLPRALAASGTGAVLQLGRELSDGRPVIGWKLIAAQHRTLPAAQALVQAAEGFTVAADPGRVARARDFALANLNRAWLSPVELAGTMAHYQLMGWSGDLVRDPGEHMAAVDDEQLQAAVRLVIRPLAQVTGGA